jgi:sugar transferase (PEP-CTERM/EpsH1 system associated)
MSADRNGRPLVVHIIYALGTGGLENGLVNILNRFPPQRYRHAIICLTSAQEFSKRLTAEDIELVELHMRPGHKVDLYWRLMRKLRDLQPDIIHSRNLAALEAQVASVFMRGVKRVHGEHGRDMADLQGRNWKYRLLRKLMSSFLVDRYIAVSKDLADWLVDVIGVEAIRVRQIYNGVDNTTFCQSNCNARAILPSGFIPSESVVVFGSVGRLAEVKNQTAILYSLRLLLDSRPEFKERVRLVLVGDGPMKDSLSLLASELKLGDCVWMPGDRDDIAQLMQAMDVFLLPSLGEGISNTVLEAMATKLPVVATDVGGNPELVEPGVTGYLVPVQDHGALCSAMIDLIESPELRVRMGQNARKRIADTFDWDVTVGEYLSLYDELLGTSA